MVKMAAAGALLALVVGVSACAEEAEPAMTKAEYLEQGNEICADGVEALDDALEEFGPVEGDVGAQVAFVQAEFMPVIRRQIDDLRGLGFPPGDEDELDELYDAVEDTLIVVGRDPASALRPGAANPFAAVNARLVDYGLTVCGES